MSRSAGTPYGPQPEPHVAADEERSAEGVLEVEVTVIPDLMAFVRDEQHEIRPALGVAAENEKRRAHVLFAQDVENSWGRVRIGAVVKCERDDLVAGVEPAERTAEYRTVPVVRAVHQSPQNCESEYYRKDHSRAVRPRTAAYMSRTASVTRD